MAARIIIRRSSDLAMVGLITTGLAVADAGLVDFPVDGFTAGDLSPDAGKDVTGTDGVAGASWVAGGVTGCVGAGTATA